MDGEVEYKMERNKLRLTRYSRFDWKVHFLKTFAFLLLLDIFMFVVVPQNLSSSAMFVQLAISLWVILLVCTIFTPIIYYWYQTQRKRVTAQLHELKELGKLRRNHKKKG